MCSDDPRERTKPHPARFPRVQWNELLARARSHGRRRAVDPDDLAQSAAAAYLSRRDAVAEPGPWLERVVRNQAVDAHRLGRREVPSVSPLLEGSRGSCATSPLDELLKKERHQHLANAVYSLAPGEQELLDRRFAREGERQALRSTPRPQLRGPRRPPGSTSKTTWSRPPARPPTISGLTGQPRPASPHSSSFAAT